MDQHLGVPLDSLVELLVCDLGLVDADFVAYDEGGLGLAGDD